MAGRDGRLGGHALKLHAPAEALERLADPRAGERFGPLGEEPLLAIDLGAGAGPESVSAPRRDAAALALASLPCPSVGIAPAAGDLDPGRAALLRGLDVVVESADACAALVQACARQPLAAAALVQLLRLSEGRPVADGLVAESLVYSTLQAGPDFAAWLAERGAPKPPAAGPPAPLRIVRAGARLELTLTHAAKRNAFSAALRDALCEALAVAVADPSIESLQLAGEGPDFCSGGDLDEFGSLPDPATAHAIRTTRSPARLLAACAARAEVRVHGACVGAGVELPAFAARVVAREDARFWLPELSMGLVPGAGGTVSLPRRIGRQRTAWLALSGARVDARTALAWGLVDAIG
ncbi:MAG TPA: enoyl-CoA hydratase/isomerase family protein [Myxococcota bacterium]|nr:enoyl-CoA hydratase/isomerase family protein [Myxococcota bacterium]